MGDLSKIKYLIISPVRNEERYIEQTIKSVVSQTVLPKKWIIVDDASTDETPKIVKSYAEIYDFIFYLRKRDTLKIGNNGDRLLLAAEARAFNFALNYVDIKEYDFIVKLDGDLQLKKNYFEEIFRRFLKNPHLGIAGGHCYELRKGKLVKEKVPNFHVRGATKIYRRECFEDIKGIEEVLGWDTIDELRAQMKGWLTRSFDEPKVIHCRPIGSSGGVLRGRIRDGVGCYFLGYHPLFMLLRASKQLFQRPYFIGGACMLWGYLKSYLSDEKRFYDEELRYFLRKQQLNRIFSFNRRT
jgi:glycosyltransferase involved in cell wall biosynthesis